MKPTYDNATPGLSVKDRKAPRYCNGRFKLWQWILIHLILFWVFVVVPVSYFWLIPIIAQYVVENAPMDIMTLDNIALMNMTATTMGFSFKAHRDRVIPFIPIRVGVGSFPATVYAPGEKALASVEIPATSFVVSNPIILNIQSQVDFRQASIEGVSSMMEKFSSEEGLVDYRVVARFRVPVYFFDIRIYRGLSLYRTVPITMKADMKEIMGAVPNLVKLPINPCMSYFICLLNR
jgi:hypothetical protein